MRNVMKGIWGCVMAIALTGCVAFSNPAAKDADEEVNDKGQQFLEQIGQFTLADLNQAMVLAGDKDMNGQVDAAGSGDQLADQCWFYLAGKVAAQGDASQKVTVSGVVSGFQVARNFKRQGGLSDEFKAACGGLIMDVRLNILKAGAGFLPGVGGLGGLIN